MTDNTQALKGTVHYRIQNSTAVLTIDNPPVNALSSGVRQGLFDQVNAALQDEAVNSIVITGKGNAFIAGADISEFSGKMIGAPFHEVMATMESSSKPIIAALNGTTLGGGLETALCCDYRIASATLIAGLPEVKLGLLPGAGGTQRLPRLIGAEAALSIMLSGEHVNGDKALALGIIDKLIDGEIVTEAVAFAETIVSQGSALRKIRDLKEHQLKDRQSPELFNQARATAKKMARGQDAPEWIIECVEAAVNLDSFDAGIKKEAENFGKCFSSPQRKALIHVFFNERTAAKIPDIPKDTPIRHINSAAVIGAGTMGGGIAMNFANAGIPVQLMDVDEANLTRGLGVIRKNYEFSVKRGKLTEEKLKQRLSLITGTLNYADLNQVDLIIEAVFENMELKKNIFKQLDSVAKTDAILASNTSALDIDEIASVTRNPENVIGTHFFSPANVMRLLEVVRGAETSKEVIASSMALAKRIKKIAVLAGNCHGFIGNRMVFKYMEQASRLMLEGALPEQIDKALFDFGFNMGPFAMHDLVGLDLGWRERKKSGKSTDLDKVADALCEAGRFGQKNGKGFYQYQEGSRGGSPDPAVKTMIEEASAALNITRRSISDAEIIQRCVYSLVNEGAKILEEGIAIRSSDIDIAYIYGYGFPAYRGGPMFYADEVGLKRVYEEMLTLQNRHGDFWQPAALLQQLAETGQTFSKWMK